MRVVATRKFHQKDIDFFEKALPTIEFIFPSNISQNFLYEQCSLGVDVFLGPPPPKDILIKALPRLKLIQVPWSGIDNISFDDAILLNIPCANSHSNATVVGEMAVSLLFELLKKVALHDLHLRSGIWHRPGDENGFYPPKKLSGSKVGLFGYGEINKSVHKMLSGYDITFSALVNRVRDIDHISNVFGFNEINSFLSDIDVLFVGAPLTNKTNQIFDSNALTHLKQSAFIVNVSRAELFQELALFNALRTHQIAGAALDVWWHNPSKLNDICMPSQFPFEELENVVLSPHRCGFSDGELPHLDDAVENIYRLYIGKVPNFLIDFERGY